jgi:hypothetical protein
MDDETNLQHWSVEVRVNGKQVLTIESNCLYGVSEPTVAEERGLRLAALHLRSWVKDEKSCDFMGLELKD